MSDNPDWADPGKWNQFLTLVAPGITLRDWFALKGLPSAPLGLSSDELAVWAYGFADSMLAERTRQYPPRSDDTLGHHGPKDRDRA